MCIRDRVPREVTVPEPVEGRFEVDDLGSTVRVPRVVAEVVVDVRLVVVVVVGGVVVLLLVVGWVVVLLLVVGWVVELVDVVLVLEVEVVELLDVVDVVLVVVDGVPVAWPEPANRRTAALTRIGSWP